MCCWHSRGHSRLQITKSIDEKCAVQKYRHNGRQATSSLTLSHASTRCFTRIKQIGLQLVGLKLTRSHNFPQRNSEACCKNLLVWLCVELHRLPCEQLLLNSTVRLSQCHHHSAVLHWFFYITLRACLLRGKEMCRRICCRVSRKQGGGRSYLPVRKYKIWTKSH